MKQQKTLPPRKGWVGLFSVNEEKSACTYEVEFSTKGGSAYGENALDLSSGVYFYTLNAGSFIQSKKMIHLK
jgi:hypothetical protein